MCIFFTDEFLVPVPNISPPKLGEKLLPGAISWRDAYISSKSVREPTNSRQSVMENQVGTDRALACRRRKRGKGKLHRVTSRLSATNSEQEFSST